MIIPIKPWLERASDASGQVADRVFSAGEGSEGFRGDSIQSVHQASSSIQFMKSIRLTMELAIREARVNA